MQRILNSIKNLSATRKIIAGFAAMILLGAALLCLPISTNAGEPPTSFLDGLLTSTSATCTVGLIRYDTYTHWTLFGHFVILLLMQIGGFGFMTLAIYLVTLTKRKIGLSQRVMMQESVSAPQIGGIVKLTRLIFIGTFIFEGVGAFLLAFYFVPRAGFFRGIFFSVFHSVSAFCNAGFDLMGYFDSASMTIAQQDLLVNLVIIVLGVVGGLGFFVWADVLNRKTKYGYYALHTKIVLVTTLVIGLGGAILIYLFEFGRSDPIENIMPSVFQSVMASTCGYVTTTLSNYSHATQLVLIIIMFIGGSPGSTAGGIKTTTVAVLFLSIVSTLRRKKSIECFHRRIEDSLVRRASCVATLYIILVVGCAMVLSWLDKVPMNAALFETASAISTDGMSLGITSSLGVVSQVLLVLLMFFGRVGSITVLLAFSSESLGMSVSRLPAEKVQIG